MPAKKTTQKKSASSRKPSKTKKPAAKKSGKAAAKKVSPKKAKVKVRKGSGAKKKGDKLFVMSMDEGKKAGKKTAVAKRSVEPKVPVLDLDNLRGVKTERITVAHINAGSEPVVHDPEFRRPADPACQRVGSVDGVAFLSLSV